MIKISLALLALGLAVGCGTDKKSDPATPAPTTPTAAVTFAQAQVIINKSCATAKCHATGGTGTGSYTGITEAAFKATKSKGRLDASAGPIMPEAGSPESAAFATADKTTLLNFLNGK